VVGNFTASYDRPYSVDDRATGERRTGKDLEGSSNAQPMYYATIACATQIRHGAKKSVSHHYSAPVTLLAPQLLDLSFCF
jgi:hypothetical protein